MSRHLRLGEAGEELAAQYLRGKGLRIVQQRARIGRYEIDIVARQGREWVFVEVKTRGSERFGSASEALTERKRGRLRRAVDAYLNRYGLEREPVRCDFVAIDLDPDGVPTVTHYPGGGSG